MDARRSESVRSDSVHLNASTTGSVNSLDSVDGQSAERLELDPSYDDEVLDAEQLELDQPYDVVDLSEVSSKPSTYSSSIGNLRSVDLIRNGKISLCITFVKPLIIIRLILLKIEVTFFQLFHKKIKELIN